MDWNITADSVPVVKKATVDRFLSAIMAGPFHAAQEYAVGDVGWSLADWEKWYEKMALKYGADYARKKWLKAYQEAGDSSEIRSARTLDQEFRSWAKKKGLYDGLYNTGPLADIARPLAWPGELIRGADSVVTSAAGIMKYMVPAAVILVLVIGSLYLYKLTKR